MHLSLQCSNQIESRVLESQKFHWQRVFTDAAVCRPGHFWHYDQSCYDHHFDCEKLTAGHPKELYEVVLGLWSLFPTLITEEVVVVGSGGGQTIAALVALGGIYAYRAVGTGVVGKPPQAQHPPMRFVRMAYDQLRQVAYPVRDGATIMRDSIVVVIDDVIDTGRSMGMLIDASVQAGCREVYGMALINRSLHEADTIHSDTGEHALCYLWHRPTKRWPKNVHEAEACPQCRANIPFSNSLIVPK